MTVKRTLTWPTAAPASFTYTRLGNGFGAAVHAAWFTAAVRTVPEPTDQCYWRIFAVVYNRTPALISSLLTQQRCLGITAIIVTTISHTIRCDTRLPRLA
jgi:hypothetical protein